MDERTAVYIISVAARLVAMHPSTLRKYESCGLLEPCRPTGRLRLYSMEDVARLHQIKTLVEEQGVNLAGVKLALTLTEMATRLRELSGEVVGPERTAAQIRAIVDEILSLLGAPASAASSTNRSASDRGSA